MNGVAAFGTKISHVPSVTLHVSDEVHRGRGKRMRTSTRTGLAKSSANSDGSPMFSSSNRVFYTCPVM